MRRSLPKLRSTMTNWPRPGYFLRSIDSTRARRAHASVVPTER
jgi:hypothetical protein